MLSSLPLATPCANLAADCTHSLNLHDERVVDTPCTAEGCGCSGFTVGLSEDDQRQLRATLAGLTPKPPAVPSTQDRQVGGSHYRKFGIQPWDVWEEYNLDPWLANCVKYLLRAGHKGPALQDLEKAKHYLEHAIWRAQRDTETG